MDEKNFRLLDFKVSDLVTHINTSEATQMELRAESKMGARCPEPADGTVYIFLNIKISDGEGGNFLFDITTTTVIQLPDGVLDVTEEDAPHCVEIARSQTHSAIRHLTEDMGMTPIDLDAQQ